MTSKAHISKDPVLAEKAEILRSSSLFVDTSDDAEFAQKQGLFLTLAGLKPVSEASSGHWEPTPNGSRSVFDDPEQVGAFLGSLELHYRLRHDEYTTDALVSLDPNLLNEYEHTDTYSYTDVRLYTTVGKLFGYPETAVEAFAHYADDDRYLLSNDDQDRVEQEGGLSERYFVNFRFSKVHWKEELAACLHWQKVLQAYHLI
jgi:hypothetical protein